MSRESGGGPSQHEGEFSFDHEQRIKKKSNFERITLKAKNLAKKAVLVAALAAGAKEEMHGKEVAQATERKEEASFENSIDDIASEVKSLEEFADYLYKLGGVPESGMGQLNDDGTVTIDYLREFRILKDDLEEQLYSLKNQTKAKRDSGQINSVKEKNSLRSCFAAIGSLKQKIDLFSDRSKFKEPKDPNALKEYKYIIDDLSHDIKRMSDMVKGAYGS